MKIRLAIIPPEYLPVVLRLTEDLRNAVNKGDMDAVDALTEKLLAVTATARSTDISEQEWRRFLSEVRARNEVFESNYVVAAQECVPFFPHAAAGTMVLQFPFNEGEGSNV
ncbi:MAG: hypothetical protein KatS3mg110_0945 [Pirellulaceae bacterium]|nr:MAG: hypothetical protein KatS3mg110_0945 [Pirellulaceae bacterium]